MDSYYDAQLEEIKQRRRQRVEKGSTSAKCSQQGTHEGNQQPTGKLQGAMQTIADARSKRLYLYTNVSTSKNPYRSQTFEDYLLHPEREVIPNTSASVVYGAVGGTSTYASAPSEAYVPAVMGGGSQTSYYDLEHSVSVLKEGDWFLKWSGRKTNVYKRFVRLNPKGTGLLWSKAPDSFLNSSIEFSTVVRLEPLLINRTSSPAETVLCPSVGGVVYAMRLWTKNYDLQIGTELKQKFDLWYDALQRLVGSHCQIHTNLAFRAGMDSVNGDEEVGTTYVPIGLPSCSDPSE